MGLFSIINNLLGRSTEQSKNAAKDRLRLVLMHDRSDIPATMMEAIRTEMKISESRWHTARIVCFCLLAGGSLIWLFNGGGTSSGRGFSPLPDGKDAESTTRRRVIDRPYYTPEDEPDEYPYRR